MQLNLTYADDPDLSATSTYDTATVSQVCRSVVQRRRQRHQYGQFHQHRLRRQRRHPDSKRVGTVLRDVQPADAALGVCGLECGRDLDARDSKLGDRQRHTGTFNSWSLSFQKLLPTTGLGEPGSDDASLSFRIFTLSQTDALSSEAWTAVGPAAITGASGQVSTIAVDPSDPSGNTVYVAGASGGIWKTTDFLTTNPNGPTYIPAHRLRPGLGHLHQQHRGLRPQQQPE